MPGGGGSLCCSPHVHCVSVWMLSPHTSTHVPGVWVLCHCPHTRGCSAPTPAHTHRVCGVSATASPSRAPSPWVLSPCSPAPGCPGIAPHSCTEPVGAQPRRRSPSPASGRAAACRVSGGVRAGSGTIPLSGYRKPLRAAAPHPRTPGALPDTRVPPAAAGAPRPAGRHGPAAAHIFHSPAQILPRTLGKSGGKGGEEEKVEEAPPCPPPSSKLQPKVGEHLKPPLFGCPPPI